MYTYNTGIDLVTQLRANFKELYRKYPEEYLIISDELRTRAAFIKQLAAENTISS